MASNTPTATANIPARPAVASTAPAGNAPNKNVPPPSSAAPVADDAPPTLEASESTDDAPAEAKDDAASPLGRSSGLLLRRKPLASHSHSLPPPPPPPPPHAEALPSSESSAPPREDDGAEITGFSRATGHAGRGAPAAADTCKQKHRRNQSGDNNNLTTIDSALGSPLTLAPLDTNSITNKPSAASPSSTAASPTKSILSSASASSSPPTLHRPQPIVRTTSDSTRFTVRHPVPDLNTRSGAYTAERLSMTSSIEDAIRDLHGELKRTASIRGDNTSPDDTSSAAAAASAPPHVPRHVSSATNIVEVNNAARNGGYSPAAYIMSPSHSLTGRLRSGSKNSTGRPDFDVDVLIVRSNKPTLENKRHNMDGTEDESLSSPRDQYAPEPQKPSTDAFHQMLGDSTSAPPRSSVELRNSGYEDLYAQAAQQADDDDRPPTPRSTATSTYDASNAFGDFDGVHCEPEQLEMPIEAALDLSDMPSPVMPEPRRHMAPPPPRDARPQSYFDHDTGQQMMYYPARVPAMLNLPPKLSRNKPKAAIRNARHSRVLQAMGHGPAAQPEYLNRNSRAPPVRESALWLPDPVQTEEFSPFGQEVTPPADETAPLQQENDGMPQPPPPARQRSPRTDQINEGQFSNQQDLPAALRASAYFDLQAAPPPVIEPKGGSAMAALEDILNASASAPVDAFTDHAFAGKLGHEVYGPEKKKKKKKNRKQAAADGMLSPGDAPGPEGSADSDRRNTITNRSVRDGELQDIDGEHRDGSESEEESDEDENGDLYQGAPTTLLAELQLRKQQQKQRTRNLHLQAPGGMHSTLLELDAVAEAQRRTRVKRRVNLAWEDPAMAAQEDESEDEDVPLGVLYATKATGANDISAAVVDLNRPIGLMERREMEENEPLSARRARLQGHEPNTLAAAAVRRSFAMTNTHAHGGTRLSRLPSPPLSPALLPQPEPSPPPEPELEDESLGDRLRRLKAKEEAEHNNLPRARPVSSTFSAELLSQFGDLDDKKQQTPQKDVITGEEEGETLGQRRRRLQAERDAREREMGSGAILSPLASPPAQGPIRRKISMADTLGAFPPSHMNSYGDMTAEAERRAIEDQRRIREQDAKMAHIRAQMPQALHGPAVGPRTGGFRGGTYNDGLGGGVSYPAPQQQQQFSPPAAYNAGGYNPYAAGQYAAPPVYGQQQYGQPMMQPMAMPQMPMAGQRQMDSIERGDPVGEVMG
ncbi:hypothetical protein F5X68DRAFT_219768 [Plectosphaerella plurivora]|uniref:Uncharacterized protein n=1 Tax=Plectosphaerella plurivora TaxID=936078 RepID=A0A9P8VIN3_9PEZI|nr:hypothetical protein F5X68DRAFT_219768 [Plectosphaerella plurivora]